jgi:hypothetical protein
VAKKDRKKSWAEERERQRENSRRFRELLVRRLEREGVPREEAIRRAFPRDC